MKKAKLKRTGKPAGLRDTMRMLRAIQYDQQVSFAYSFIGRDVELLAEHYGIRLSHPRLIEMVWLLIYVEALKRDDGEPRLPGGHGSQIAPVRWIRAIYRQCFNKSLPLSKEEEAPQAEVIDMREWKKRRDAA